MRRPGGEAAGSRHAFQHGAPRNSVAFVLVGLQTWLAPRLCCPGQATSDNAGVDRWVRDRMLRVSSARATARRQRTGKPHAGPQLQWDSQQLACQSETGVLRRRDARPGGGRLWRLRPRFRHWCIDQRSAVASCASVALHRRCTLRRSNYCSHNRRQLAEKPRKYRAGVALFCLATRGRQQRAPVGGAMTDRPLVAAIGTGGTISSMGRDSTDVLDYPDFGVKLPIEEVVGRYPEIAKIAEVLPVPFRGVGSTAIGPADWLALCGRARRGSRPAPLDRLRDHARHRDAGGDRVLPEPHAEDRQARGGGRRAAAGQRASAPTRHEPPERSPRGGSAGGARARRAGLLNDEIQAAREVTKASTCGSRPSAARPRGARLRRPRRRIAIYRRPTRRHAPDTEFDVAGCTELPRVDIVCSYAGADGAAVDAFVAAGARAIVSACLRAGRPDAARASALWRGADAESSWCNRAGPAAAACAAPHLRERGIRRRRQSQSPKGPRPADARADPDT